MQHRNLPGLRSIIGPVGPSVPSVLLPANVLTADFQLGTVPNTITTGDAGSATQWNTVTVGALSALTYDAAHSVKSAKVTVGNPSADVFAAWTTALGTVTDHYGRGYFWLDANPASNLYLIRLRGDAGDALRIGVTATGLVRILDATGAVGATGTQTVPLGGWFRLEYHVTHGLAQTAEVRLYNATGTLLDTIASASLPTGQNTTSIRFGNNTVAAGVVNYSFWMGALTAGALTWPGPATFNYTDNEVDTVAVADAATFDSALAEADSATLADSEVDGFSFVTSDAPALTDASTFAASLAEADTLALADSAATLLTINLTVTDTMAVADASTADIGLVEADAATLTDSEQDGASLTASDTLAFTDTASLDDSLLVADTVALTDDAQLTLGGDNLTLDVADTVSVTDEALLEIPAAEWVGGGTLITPKRVKPAPKPRRLTLRLADTVVLTDWPTLTVDDTLTVTLRQEEELTLLLTV